MKKLLAFGCWLLAISCWVSCSEKLSPEEQAAQAALSYYHRILEGYPDGLQAAKADDSDLPDDYRDQRELTFKQFADDIQRQHGGLKAVELSSNPARRDSLKTKDGQWEHVTYAFLLLSFNDSTKEEIVVPMVEHNGEWLLK
jgi:hypothetical protein